MSKAQKIRDLYDAGVSIPDIADEVGCSRDYVRVCARQRRGKKGQSQADLRYIEANKERVRERYAEYQREILRLGNRELANATRRRVYQKLRERGLSHEVASSKASNARQQVLVATSRWHRVQAKNEGLSI